MRVDDPDISFDDDDFEAEVELLAADEQALSLDDTQIDAHFRAMQRALTELGDGMVDAQLDADEAWLEALVEEDRPPPWAAPSDPFSEID